MSFVVGVAAGDSCEPMRRAAETPPPNGRRRGRARHQASARRGRAGRPPRAPQGRSARTFELEVLALVGASDPWTGCAGGSRGENERGMVRKKRPASGERDPPGEKRPAPAERAKEGERGVEAPGAGSAEVSAPKRATRAAASSAARRRDIARSREGGAGTKKVGALGGRDGRRSLRGTGKRSAVDRRPSVARFYAVAKPSSRDDRCQAVPPRGAQLATREGWVAGLLPPTVAASAGSRPSTPAVSAGRVPQTHGAPSRDAMRPGLDVRSAAVGRSRAVRAARAGFRARASARAGTRAPAFRSGRQRGGFGRTGGPPPTPYDAEKVSRTSSQARNVRPAIEPETAANRTASLGFGRRFPSFARAGRPRLSSDGRRGRAGRSGGGGRAAWRCGGFAVRSPANTPPGFSEARARANAPQPRPGGLALVPAAGAIRGAPPATAPRCGAEAASPAPARRFRGGYRPRVGRRGRRSVGGGGEGRGGCRRGGKRADGGAGSRGFVHVSASQWRSRSDAVWRRRALAGGGPEPRVRQTPDDRARARPRPRDARLPSQRRCRRGAPAKRPPDAAPASATRRRKRRGAPGLPRAKPGRRRRRRSAGSPRAKPGRCREPRARRRAPADGRREPARRGAGRPAPRIVALHSSAARLPGPMTAIPLGFDAPEAPTRGSLGPRRLAAARRQNRALTDRRGGGRGADDEVGRRHGCGARVARTASPWCR